MNNKITTNKIVKNQTIDSSLEIFDKKECVLDKENSQIEDLDYEDKYNPLNLPLSTAYEIFLLVFLKYQNRLQFNKNLYFLSNLASNSILLISSILSNYNDKIIIFDSLLLIFSDVIRIITLPVSLTNSKFDFFSVESDNHSLKLDFYRFILSYFSITILALDLQKFLDRNKKHILSFISCFFLLIILISYCCYHYVSTKLNSIYYATLLIVVMFIHHFYRKSISYNRLLNTKSEFYLQLTRILMILIMYFFYVHINESDINLNQKNKLINID